MIQFIPGIGAGAEGAIYGGDAGVGGDAAGSIGGMRGDVIGVAEPFDEPKAGERLRIGQRVAVIGRGLAVFDADGEQVGIDIARPEGVGTWPGAAVAPGGVFNQAALHDGTIAPDDEVRSGVNLAGLEVARYILRGAGHGRAVYHDIAKRLAVAASGALRVAILVVGHPESFWILREHGGPP